MSRIPRIYEAILARHLAEHRQMAFVTGPRQVGKTTSCRLTELGPAYLDWDDQDDRRLISRGSRAISEWLGLERIASTPRVVVFDELHKYRHWKRFLKGFFDHFGDRCRIIATGSSRMDVYRRGGDSLMGRYFLYRMHPLSVGELLDWESTQQELRVPRRLSPVKYTSLWEHGGFPEPFVKRDARFSRRWRDLRNELLVREDVRDMTRIQDLAQLEILVRLLAESSGSQLVYSNLATEVNVTVDTIRRWLATLCSMYVGFLLRPWYRNVPKSLRKEPKWYLRDWSGIEDPGRRAETFVACHLLKAVESWQDLGLGSYELRYLRDKEKREVDFVVIRNRKPWFLVEVKHSDTTLHKPLVHFQEKTGALHAFQVVLDLSYVEADCFQEKCPCVVPARTLLAQLP